MSDTEEDISGYASEVGEGGESEYESEHDNITDTVGFKDLVRVGGMHDEDLNAAFGTSTTGLTNKQQKVQLMLVSTEEQFNNDVLSIIKDSSFNFTSSDMSTIKKNISKLPFLKYKNPYLYVLGYFIYLDNMSARTFNSKIKAVDRIIKDKYTIPAILKYARYWKMIIKLT